jgi:hypothetical protein
MKKWITVKKKLNLANLKNGNQNQTGEENSFFNKNVKIREKIYKRKFS